MRDFLATGYPYELIGLVYFLFSLAMSRGRAVTRFSRRTRVLTLLAAIALVGAVPFHYGATVVGIAVMLALAVASLVSSFVDVRSSR